MGQCNKDDTFEKGDIVIFGGSEKAVDGHIQVYDGNRWISDFKQNNFIPGKCYTNNTSTLYRLNDQNNDNNNNYDKNDLLNYHYEDNLVLSKHLHDSKSSESKINLTSTENKGYNSEVPKIDFVNSTSFNLNSYNFDNGNTNNLLSSYQDSNFMVHTTPNFSGDSFKIGSLSNSLSTGNFLIGKIFNNKFKKISGDYVRGCDYDADGDYDDGDFRD